MLFIRLGLNCHLHSLEQNVLDELSDEDAGDEETSSDEVDTEGPSHAAKRPRLRGVVRPDEFFGRHDNDDGDGDDGDSRPEEAEDEPEEPEDEPHSGPVQIPESKLNKRVQVLNYYCSYVSNVTSRCLYRN